MRSFLLVPLLILMIFMAACSRDNQSETVVEDAPVSDWRLVIVLPDIELPVSLHLALDGSEAWINNGAEKVLVPEINREGDSWVLRFPTFNNTLVLKKSGSGLSGSLTLVKRGYEQVMELEAEADRGFRFVEDARPKIDVTGRWEVLFTDDDGKESAAVGEFDQQDEKLTGTFLTPLGDYRYLAGEVDGNQLHLSTFDGAHAFVFTASSQQDGTLKGDFWSGTKWHESWVAKRNFDAQLPDAYQLTYLKDGYDRLEFSFPGLDGVPVSIDDEKFQNKVVLVNLSGTWCPNCADEMEFLSGVYGKNHERGLEIITLLYEHFEDFETSAAQGRALVKKHNIEFDVLVAGMSDKTLASETLPMLNRVLAFPTLIFIDRLGVVRRIHTGFSGPGTGQHYDEFKNEFQASLENLLNEHSAKGP